MNDVYVMIDRLAETKTLSKQELLTLLSMHDHMDIRAYLAARARAIAKQSFGNKIYVRGLIEFSNYCKNDCYYCGIRRGNHRLNRYRLRKKEILTCCEEGYNLGFRTFVLQSGEDETYRVDEMSAIISSIRQRFPDCAITLSIGEKRRDEYQSFFEAGADRYLLRHETRNSSHYQQLHPFEMMQQNRLKCLNDLKEIGFQTGCGIMIGSPYQTLAHIVEDLLFMQLFKPEMVGIGPFLPHHETPFANKTAGSLTLTLMVLSIVRLMHPMLLLPATTALATLHPEGREQGILAGANVVMPNMSPMLLRKEYQLYDHKVSTNEESAQSINKLRQQLSAIGYEISMERGDYPGKRKQYVL